jgi:quercetin dioxygenase-like cupin family protein
MLGDGAYSGRVDIWVSQNLISLPNYDSASASHPEGTQMNTELILPPKAGRRIVGGGLDATVKATVSGGALTSSFEIVVPPGFDVGAHSHPRGEEVFFVLEGELDVLAFEPVDRSVADWHRWKSASGLSFLRGGPGAFMRVPPGTPHAFANQTDRNARKFFQSSAPEGHENYFGELAEALRQANGAPDPRVIGELRRRYDIEQLTSLQDGA